MSDDSSDQTVRVLTKIYDELVSLHGEIRTGFAAVNARLDLVTARLEHIRDFAGERFRDHEERIRAIEEQLKPRGTPGGTRRSLRRVK